MFKLQIIFGNFDFINSSDTTTRNMDKEISAKTIESDILVYRCNEISLQRAPDTFKNH